MNHPGSEEAALCIKAGLQMHSQNRDLHNEFQSISSLTVRQTSVQQYDIIKSVL